MEASSLMSDEFENESVADEAVEAALDELVEIAEAGKIKEGRVPQIRKLIKTVGSEIVILEELGPEWVERYFKAQQGGHIDYPYFLPCPIAEDQLGAYLDFEFGDEDYRRQCVAEFITDPLDRAPFENIRDLNLGCNLALSLLRKDIDFFTHMGRWVGGAEMAAFLDRVKVGIASNKARQSFSYLFGKKRWGMLTKYVEEANKRKRIKAQKLLKKLKAEDREFFNRLQINSILGF